MKAALSCSGASRGIGWIPQEGNHRITVRVPRKYLRPNAVDLRMRCPLHCATVKDRYVRSGGNHAVVSGRQAQRRPPRTGSASSGGPPSSQRCTVGRSKWLSVSGLMYYRATRRVNRAPGIVVWAPFCRSVRPPKKALGGRSRGCCARGNRGGGSGDPRHGWIPGAHSEVTNAGSGQHPPDVRGEGDRVRLARPVALAMNWAVVALSAVARRRAVQARFR